MDKLENYRKIIQTILDTHAQYISSNQQIETLKICDNNTNNYLLLDLGWNRIGRVHSVALHLRIRDEKIWIEWDGTEIGVANELLELGVLKEDIVLGFYRPERRALTEFAIA